MNNIAEGIGRKSNFEFIRFLDISQSSAIEVLSMLYVLQDLNYMESSKLNQIRGKTEEVKGPPLACSPI
jgi:four helix bundle protein